ncbi:endoglucanase 5 [Dorcoceras hygrometricum]|uniref:Endoglucanase 5 n=1 Tax=Dorcoceras hygrometricum TaxID=472368 RepID=A0A2Z7DDX3_9LAMI|nr:endoglucanase 5 [Dorcoceras hygrometricum]
MFFLYDVALSLALLFTIADSFCSTADYDDITADVIIADHGRNWDTGLDESLLMYYELMDPCVHGMEKWQHRGVMDPEIEHAGRLGSLALNGASDDPVDFMPTGVIETSPITQRRATTAAAGGRRREVCVGEEAAM